MRLGERQRLEKLMYPFAHGNFSVFNTKSQEGVHLKVSLCLCFKINCWSNLVQFE